MALSPQLLSTLRECSRDEAAFHRLVALYETQIDPQVPQPLPDAETVSLQQRLRHYQVMVSAIAFPISLIDRDYSYQIVNDAYLAYSGLHRDQIEGRHVAELLGEQVFESVIRPHLDDCLNGERVEYDAWFDVPTLGRRWLHVTYSPYSDNGSVVTGVISTSRDLTDLRQTLEALQQSEARLRFLLDNSPIVLFSSRPDGDYAATYVSENAQQIVGYSPEAFTGDTSFWASKIHPDDAHAVFSLIATIPTTGRSTQDYRFLHADGQYRWMRAEVRMAYADQGQPLQLVGCWQDIHERKQVEEALRESEARLRLIMDNAWDMISLTDANGVITFANAAHTAALGYPQEAMIGRPILDIVHRDDAAVIGHRLRRVLQSDERVGKAQYRCRRADGNYIWLETVGTRLVDAEGNTQSIVFCSRDLTERMQAEAAEREQSRLEIELRKEQEASRFKTRMLGRISHEFRTPLAVIQSSAELLERYHARMSDDQRQERVTKIRDEIRHLTSMLNTLTLIVRRQTNRLQLNRSHFDLGALCQDVMERIGTSIGESHRFELLSEPSVILIDADHELLMSVITNLLTNAVKYSPSDSLITLNLQANGERVLLEVRDQGMGIAPDDLAQIFDPFFRGTNSGETTGMGLGLSLVKEAVEAHEGAIEIDSAQGNGTRFRIELPRGLTVLRTS